MCCASVCVKKRDEAYSGNVARDVRTWRTWKMARVDVYLRLYFLFGSCFGARLPLCQLSLQRAPATSIAKGKKFFKSAPMALNS